MGSFDVFFFGQLSLPVARRLRAHGIELPHFPDQEPTGWLLHRARQLATVSAADGDAAVAQVRAALGSDVEAEFTDWDAAPHRG